MTEQTIPELNPGPVIQFNEEGIITSINWSTFAILGQNVKKGALVAATIPGMSEMDVGQCIRDGAVMTHIAQVRDRHFQFTVRGFKNLGVGGVYGSDVTERLQLEEALANQVLVRQAEKLAALGKLAAGMAHWLNNPAAAASRSASQMADAIERLQSLGASLHACGLTAAQWAYLAQLRAELSAGASNAAPLGPLELSEREDAIITWLEARDVENAWETAPALAQADVDRDALERLAAEVPESTLGEVTAWLAAGADVASLVGGLKETTAAISNLIGAFKSYTHMDEGEVQDVDIHDGIEQSLTMLQHRLEGITVVREFGDDIPRVTGNGSELNQVWTNLLDNAVDAVRGHGTIRVGPPTKTGRSSSR